MFGSKGFKNIRKYFYVQIGRVCKAHNRKKDEDEYDEYGYWFHGNMNLIILFYCL